MANFIAGRMCSRACYRKHGGERDCMGKRVDAGDKQYVEVGCSVRSVEGRQVKSVRLRAQDAK